MEQPSRHETSPINWDIESAFSNYPFRMVDWMVCQICMEGNAEPRHSQVMGTRDPRSCKCVIRGGGNFYIARKSHVLTSLSTCPNLARCTGIQQPQGGIGVFFTPCSMQVMNRLPQRWGDIVDFCTIRCTRPNCDNHTQHTRAIPAHHLINLAYFKLKAHLFRRACAKCKEIQSMRRKMSCAHDSGLQVGTFFLDAPSRDPVFLPLGTQDEDHPLNIHLFWKQLHKTRLLVWKEASGLACLMRTCTTFYKGVSFLDLAQSALIHPSRNEMQRCSARLSVFPFVSIGTLTVKISHPSPGNPQVAVALKWAMHGHLTVQIEPAYHPARLYLPSPNRQSHFMLVGMGNRLVGWARGAPLYMVLGPFNPMPGDELGFLVICSVRMGAPQEKLPGVIRSYTKARTFPHEMYQQLEDAVEEVLDHIHCSANMLSHMMIFEYSSTLLLLIGSFHLNALTHARQLSVRKFSPLKVLAAVDSRSNTARVGALSHQFYLHQLTNARDRLSSPLCMSYIVSIPVPERELKLQEGTRVQLWHTPEDYLWSTRYTPIH